MDSTEHFMVSAAIDMFHNKDRFVEYWRNCMSLKARRRLKKVAESAKSNVMLAMIELAEEGYVGP